MDEGRIGRWILFTMLKGKPISAEDASKIIGFLKSHHSCIDLNRADLECSMSAAIALHHSPAKFLESSLHLDEVLSMIQSRPDNHSIVF